MNAIAERAVETPAAKDRLLRPSFLGAIGGELLKLRRQRATVAMLAAAVLLFVVVIAALFSNDNQRQLLHRDHTAFFFNVLDVLVTLFETGSGIFLLLVSARLVGMEYSGGTIRVLLARGTGRLQLLAAKLVAMALVGLCLLAGFAILAAASLSIIVRLWEGSLSPITSLPQVAWHDLGMCTLAALLSLGTCILLGSTAAIVGRSMTFGIGAAMGFFPADNFGTVVMSLITAITHQTFWMKVTAYLLGPNLNVLPVLLQSDHRGRAAFATPLQRVDSTHALVVIGVYAAAFVVLSTVLTRRRDVLE